MPKIFTIDRDADVCAALDAILAPYGYEVRSYQSAEAFMADHHPTQVGCIVIDLMMAEMGGSELLRFLYETGSLLSVANFSGLFEAGSLDLGARASALLLDKPYEVSTLLTMVSDGMAGSFRRRAERHRME